MENVPQGVLRLGLLEVDWKMETEILSLLSVKREKKEKKERIAHCRCFVWFTVGKTLLFLCFDFKCYCKLICGVLHASRTNCRQSL